VARVGVGRSCCGGVGIGPGVLLLVLLRLFVVVAVVIVVVAVVIVGSPRSIRVMFDSCVGGVVTV
jgi:hypothetical protein